MSGFLSSQKKVLTLALTALIAAMLFANASFLTKRPISLTKLDWVSESQDYLEPVKNMTVESARGPTYWNRLSNNYFFYDLGIGSHANSTIAYNLGGRFARFESDIGIDTEGTDAGKAVFSVRGDGRELYRSKALGKFDWPVHVDVEIKGVKILELKISAGTDSINGLHADWLNPILWP